MFMCHRSFAAASVLAALLFSTTSHTGLAGQSAARSTGDVSRISTREFMTLHGAGGVLPVDVRSADVFRLGRIGGAINVPLGEIASRAMEIRARAGNRVIVTYCSCAEELSSAEAGLRLMAAGVSNVRALVGGYPEWVLAGGKIER